MRNFVIILLIIAMLSGCSHNIENSQIQEPVAYAVISESATETEIIIENDKIDLTADTEWMPEILPLKDEIYTNDIYENNFNWTPSDTVDDSELSDIIEDLPIVTQTTPLEDMLSEIDDITYIVLLGKDMTVAHPARRWHATLAQMVSRDPNNQSDVISRKIPVNFLRKMESGGYYTVCKVKNGGYAYFIFYYDPVDTETIYNWGCVYSEKSVSYSDFANIKPGDSVLDVIKVDPSAKLILAEHQYERDVFGVKEFAGQSQLLLLTDGLLEITYDLRDMTPVKKTAGNYEYEYVSMDSDDLVVKEIKYFPDFIYNSTKAKGYYGVDTALPVQILEQDYPPAS